MLTEIRTEKKGNETNKETLTSTKNRETWDNVLAVTLKRREYHELRETQAIGNLEKNCRLETAKKVN